MSFYILRRILYAIPIAFGVSVVCFSLVYIAPGDPLQTVMPPDATAETIEIVKKAYGFDKPLPMQFLIWLGRVLTGDFGMSISTRRPVFLEVSEALANTSLLALFAVPLAFFTGYVMGAIAGCFPGRWVDRVVTGAAVAEVHNQDFVQTLRAKGLSEWAVTRHVLKNSLPQVLAVMGLQFGYLLGGSILVETVFTWPGSGFLLSKAIINRDVPVLQGTILTLSLVFVAINLVVDLLQSVIDPRIRRA